jgi:hypothetical protein
LRPATGALVAVLLASGRAFAEDGPRGLELGLQIVIAHPAGAVGAGSPATTPRVGDLAPTWLPVGLDGGYRVTPHVYLGATLEWGPITGQALGCPGCGFRYDLQGRAELRLHALPRNTFDPWLSLGFGWEVLQLSLPSASATYNGPVLTHLEVGVDVRSKVIAVGPYFGLSLSEFATHSLDPVPPGETSSVEGQAVHEWFSFGLRGTYGPF